MRKLFAFALGLVFAAPLTLGAGEMYVMAQTYKGRQDLLAEAMRITGRDCKHDQRLSEEAGERGHYCEAPRIVNRDLSAMGAAGAYDPSTNPRVVYVDFKGIDRFNREAAPADRIAVEDTILHEYVHYLQWVDGDLSPRLSVCEVVALEIEAHKADQEYKHPGKIDQRTLEIIASYKMQCLMPGGNP